MQYLSILFYSAYSIIACCGLNAGSNHRFRSNCYHATYELDEGVNPAVTVTVEQTVRSLVDIHLLLTPLTYAQYTQRASQPGSTLPPLNEFYRGLPDAAECKNC